MSSPRSGKSFARLPLDPRLGRMLLAARDQHCLREMLIIASALSVQDPRERPPGAQEAADQAHRVLADERSEFSGLVKLWDALQQRLAHKKSNRRFSEELRREFISPRRLREWMDVQSQLHRIVSELGWRLNDFAAHLRAAYTWRLRRACSATSGASRSTPTRPIGARHRTWARVRSASTCGRARRWHARPVAWIMAAELVETSRLFARTVAGIEPTWLERVGAHLLSARTASALGKAPRAGGGVWNAPRCTDFWCISSGGEFRADRSGRGTPALHT